MEVKGSAALVTGANRGIGRAFTRARLTRGAAKVYAAVRNPENAVAAAAALASDTTVVIDNAGIARAFAPVLAANGGGALVNVLSVASWRVKPRRPGHAAPKAAEWSLTNALRAGLRGQGTLVVGVHVGPVDTDATAGWDVPKLPAAQVAARPLDAIGSGEAEALVDEVSRRVRAVLSGPVELLEPAP
ncbi:SDR family NAD(P)-dependent oxidoreductase [Streptomyces sp. NPDC052109]|uniref:SDR family NAD(P)-dependent oxidoreductase n=1 Tax=Streptomyces sp. NPDC052109 TaxID=3155527 RepID=UPI003443B8C0